MNALKLISLLILTLAITGCASKRKEKNSSPTEASGNEYSLELNGSSDDRKAGQLRTIFFDYNSADLSSRAKEDLKRNAEYLKQKANVVIQIEGHCDERGGRQYNLALGERRARVIRDYLRASGIKQWRMKTFSWGNEKPLSEEASEEGWSKNRRGAFVVIGI